MRFNNYTTSSLSSLPERIDHGNAAAAADIAMSTNTFRTKSNMSATVSASLAGPVNSQHASYLHAFQHVCFIAAFRIRVKIFLRYLP